MTSSNSNSSRLQLIEEMLREDPGDSFLQYAAALEHEKIGDTDKAIQLLDELLKRDPEYLGAYYQLGKMLESKNCMDRAAAIYRAGIEKASQQNNSKAKGELSEALMLLLDED